MNMVGSFIATNLQKVRAKIVAAAQRCGRDSAGIKLIGVSKQQGVAQIQAAAALGLADFAENYWQEAEPKLAALSSLALSWHFIGALQSNKAKNVAGRFAWIHGVDRLSLARALSQALPESGQQKILLQVNVAEENTKNGCTIAEGPHLLEQIQSLPGLQIQGLMTMPPLAGEPEANRKYFAQLARLAQSWGRYLGRDHQMIHLSMGTSHDFQVAVEEGATMVRIGTDIFCARKSEDKT